MLKFVLLFTKHISHLIEQDLRPHHRLTIEIYPSYLNFKCSSKQYPVSAINSGSSSTCNPLANNGNLV